MGRQYNNKRFFEAAEKDIINNTEITEEQKSKLTKALLLLKDKKINLMITGATGCGKSSTINALFNTHEEISDEVAKIGVGVNPETMQIKNFELEGLTLWDSPGLGDGKEADSIHAKNIISKLHERDENGELLIDLVLVVLDGSTRDLGTSYELINQVIIPNLGEDSKKRILIAINQADVAMKGKHWDEENNKPLPPLEKFLEDKVASVQKRIGESTGLHTTPIYYAAGGKEDGCPQARPYNLAKLLYYIIKHTPHEKRLGYMGNMNQDSTMWEDNDGFANYRQGILDTFSETFSDCVTSGSDIGKEIGGALFDRAGEVVGKMVGRTLGAAVGVVKGIGKSVASFFGF